MVITYYHYSTNLLLFFSSMASLSLSHFLSFPSFFPRRHNCHQQLLQQQQRPHLCRFRTSSIGKARFAFPYLFFYLIIVHVLIMVEENLALWSIGVYRRKVKTNAELYDDIREFITANGLPEDYVPTVKEFSQLGRFF